MQLRYYQSEAIEAAWDFLRNNDGNPCIEIPTGGGKSAIIATMARQAVEQWGGRVCILSHVRELVEQVAGTIARIAPNLRMGIYSAGLGLKQTREPVIVAGIQSIYKQAFKAGPFDIVIVDEAQLIPPSGDGMYRTFIDECRLARPTVRVIGLTATPYRMSTGLICHPENVLNEICYRVSVKTLIDQGFLSRLRSKRGVSADLSQVHKRGGEYIESEMQAAMMGVVRPAVAEMIRLAEGRKSCLVFCAGVSHAETVLELLREAGEDADLVTGDTLLPIRDEVIQRFKAGRLRWLVNITVLTVGFDAPNVDCVAILRATLSPGLFYQMVGRGFRLSEGKQDCLVLDFGSNLDVHGPVDQIRAKEARRPGEGGGEAVTKACPQCGDVCFASIQYCPNCGHCFFEKKPRHEPTATDAAVLSSEVPVEEADVTGVTYSKHIKRASSMEEMDNPKPPTMRVDYHVGNVMTMSEWVCIEHEGFALAKAHLWWSARTHEPFPESVVEAVQMCKAGLVGQPSRIRYRTKPGSRWPEIVGFEGIEKPEHDPDFIPNFETEEVPF